MEKSETLNLRVNPTLKKDTEAVLGRLGVPMYTAVDMFLNQMDSFCRDIAKCHGEY